MKHLLALILLVTSCQQDSASEKKVFGDIEVKEIHVASRVAARVRQLHAGEGERVKAEQLLLSLDDDVIRARELRAEAQIAAAETQQQIAEDAVRPQEIAQLEVLVESSQKQLELAQRTLQRMEALVAEGAVSRQQFEEVEFKFHAAQAKLRADQAKLELAQLGARSEQRRGAAAMVTKAQTGLQEVQAYRKDLLLKAPIAGEVWRILAQPGELVPQGYPILTLLDIDHPYAVFFVSETLLGQLPMGQELTIAVTALKRTLKGKVSYIAPQGSYAMRTYTQDRGAVDIKTFEVRVNITEPTQNLRPGMTCELILPTPTKP